MDEITNGQQMPNEEAGEQIIVSKQPDGTVTVDGQPYKSTDEALQAIRAKLEGEEATESDDMSEGFNAAFAQGA